MQSIAWLMTQIWFGNTYLSFRDASSFHPVFGPILMVIFAALSNTLLLTSERFSSPCQLFFSFCSLDFFAVEHGRKNSRGESVRFAFMANPYVLALHRMQRKKLVGLSQSLMTIT